MIYTRQQLEEYESQTWRLMLFTAKIKGRLHPEEEADFRPRFLRDRERILHTTAFRRPGI